MQAGQDDRWREAGPCTSTIHWRDWHSVPGRRNFLPVVSLTPPQRWDKAGERNSRQTHMLSPTGLTPLLTSAFNLKPYYKGLRNSLHLFILLLPFLPKYIQKPGFTSQVLQSCKMKRNWCLEKNGGAPLVSSETSSASLPSFCEHIETEIMYYQRFSSLSKHNYPDATGFRFRGVPQESGKIRSTGY